MRGAQNWFKLLFRFQLGRQLFAIAYACEAKTAQSLKTTIFKNQIENLNDLMLFWRYGAVATVCNNDDMLVVCVAGGAVAAGGGAGVLMVVASITLNTCRPKATGFYFFFFISYDETG